MPAGRLIRIVAFDAVWNMRTSPWRRTQCPIGAMGVAPIPTRSSRHTVGLVTWYGMLLMSRTVACDDGRLNGQWKSQTDLKSEAETRCCSAVRISPSGAKTLRKTALR